jgi:hypothetical protein
MATYITIIVIIIIIIIIFYIINKVLSNKTIENFCKIPNVDKIGDINDKRVLLDYPPQSNIFTSSCDQYWKNWPLEHNNTQIEDNPNVIKSDQLDLPKEKQFGDNDQKAGLINFDKLANLVSDSNNMDIYNSSEQRLLDPVTHKKLEYQYELQFSFLQLNKETWKNRWYNYNPMVKTYFNYDEIKSPIKNINILNLEMKKKLDLKQKDLMTNNQLLLFGLVQFEIFKYKILDILYYNDTQENKENNELSPSNDQQIYVIEIMFFREKFLYVPTFSYVGYVKNNIPILTNIKYIGRNSTDNILLSDFYNPNEIKQEIINSNFSNTPVIEKDPDAVVALIKANQESYKLKNQYACFNLNYDVKQNNYILPYYTREACESMYDAYGKAKEVGIFDSPCKKDSDCPFFEINKNYKNNYGKCKSDGYCELPINMKPIGYRYYTNNPYNMPLCYNCNSDSFKISTTLGPCCKEQYNKEKYPFLKTPDYAFENDFLERKNFFNGKFCKTKGDSLDINCENILV